MYNNETLLQIVSVDWKLILQIVGFCGGLIAIYFKNVNDLNNLTVKSDLKFKEMDEKIKLIEVEMKEQRALNTLVIEKLVRIETQMDHLIDNFKTHK
jgi:hypothetical protein